MQQDDFYLRHRDQLIENSQCVHSLMGLYFTRD